MENPTHSFRETNYFSSYKNRKYKSKTNELELAKGKSAIFVAFILSKEIFVTLFFFVIYSVINTLSEFTYFYVSKSTSYSFVAF